MNKYECDEWEIPPVADEILITRVDEGLHVLRKEVVDLRRKVEQPVGHESKMYGLRTFRPLSALHSESSDNFRESQELINVGEIVAKRGIRALVADVVHVESGFRW